jgi:hypothetical protein
VAGKVIVIGETMERVEFVAGLLGYTHYRIRAPHSWKNNAAWMRRYINMGYDILDIGLDPLPREYGPSTVFPKEQGLADRMVKKGKLKAPIPRPCK